MNYPEPLCDMERALSILGYGPTCDIIGACQDTQFEIARLSQERDGLREQVKVRGQMRDEAVEAMNKAEQENARLKAWNQERSGQFAVTENRLARDNTKLRQALEGIVDQLESYEGCSMFDDADTKALEQARDALLVKPDAPLPNGWFRDCYNKP